MANDAQSAYDDLRQLTPSLAAELDHLRASLREHNMWLQHYGHGSNDAAALAAVPVMALRAVEAPVPRAEGTLTPVPINFNPWPPLTSNSSNLSNHDMPNLSQLSLHDDDSHPSPAYTTTTPPASPPPYAASDVPLYSTAVRDDVLRRRNQLIEWLRQGEDVLREYSARFAQLAAELHAPVEDVLGTWNEAAPDNALPDYTTIERREELMIGEGEMPPVYVEGQRRG